MHQGHLLSMIRERVAQVFGRSCEGSEAGLSRFRDYLMAAANGSPGG